MKKMNLKGKEIDAVLVSMVSTKGTNVIELRKIDRVCTVLLDKFNSEELIKDKDNYKLELEKDFKIEFEDADFEYMKTSFYAFKGWNPSFRKVVLELDDKIQSAAKAKKE